MTAGRAGVIARPPRSWITNWANAYALQAGGGGQAHVACFGDSVTQGYYATEPFYQNGWTATLRSALNTLTGVTPGTGWTPMKDEFQIVDDRTAAAGSWVNATTGPSFFQNYYYANGSGDTYEFGPVTCSAFKVMYLRVSGGGSFTVKIDGSLAATISCNGATAVLTQEISAGSAGSHTMLIEWASGNAFPIAVEAVSNPTAGARVSSVAHSGAQCSLLVGQATLLGSRYCVQAMGQVDLAVVAFGLNEANAGTSTTTYKTHMSTLIGDLKTMGASVLILAAPPPNTSFISAVTWNSFRTAMAELSVSLGTGLLDMTDYWTSYAVSSAYYHDNVHPNNAGHAAMGPIVADFVIDAIA